MNKYFVSLVLCFVFLSCNQEKISQLELTVERLTAQLLILENENNLLKEEINNLMETDQFYYQSGADEFSLGNFENAIDWMNRLKIKFPASSLISSADTLIRNSNTEIRAIYERERANLNQLIREVRNIDIEDAIRRLEAYVRGNHPEDLIATARTSLDQYRNEFEAIRSVREVEQQFGVRLTDYFTGWNENTSFGQTLFQPNVALRFTNITNNTLPTRTVGSFGIETTNYIEIKVDFVNTARNEIHGTGSTYLVGYSENLPAGMARTVYINSSVGYTSRIPFDRLPELVANIYINNRLYRSVNVRRAARTGG